MAAEPDETFTPDLWIQVERILALVPSGVDLEGCQTGEDLINTLGMNGAIPALQAWMAALEHHHGNALTEALRAALLQPLEAPDRSLFGQEPIDGTTWTQMFDTAWQTSDRHDKDQFGR